MPSPNPLPTLSHPCRGGGVRGLVYLAVVHMAVVNLAFGNLVEGAKNGGGFQRGIARAITLPPVLWYIWRPI